MRPQSLDEFVGQEHLVGERGALRRMIERGHLTSMVLWGPPGSGKTTLARLLAEAVEAPFATLSAVMSGVADVRQAIARAREWIDRGGRSTVLFIDEIHRFNKSQQDALLPQVEDGTITLIGATTENPYFEVNSALLSRLRVFRLEPLSNDDLRSVVIRAMADERGLGGRVTLDEDALEHLVDISGGDARSALNILESAAAMAGDGTAAGEAGAGGVVKPTLEEIETAAQQRVLTYDRAGDGHFDTVSAFIKSLRGNDPDAALYWLSSMVAAGEDPRFIARRLIISASEDVGNADPHALQVAVSAAYALDWVGLPEAQYALAQATAYIAAAPKSNRAGSAYWAAMDDVLRHGSLPVPNHLRSATWREKRDFGHGRGYIYPHDYEGADVEQQYLPDLLAQQGRRYYQPSDHGYERTIGERMEGRRAARETDAERGGALHDLDAKTEDGRDEGRRQRHGATRRAQAHEAAKKKGEASRRVEPHYTRRAGSPLRGSENPDRAKFCLECATPLGGATESTGAGTRKLVTILFADVVGSTALGEQLDPEALRGLLTRYFTAARTIVERHGGTIEKFIGDAVMAVFGIPSVHEDDGLRAVRAALELRDAIRALNDELASERGIQVEFRIGLNSGEVVAGTGDPGGTLVTGDAVNVAARLEQAAAAGDVLIGEPTLRLVRDFVRTEPAAPIDAKGKSQPLVAHRLLSLVADQRQAGRSDLPFVGRRREQARLMQAFEDAGLERRCYLFTLLGSAGVGKSRLVDEFVSSIGTTAEVLRGRCLPYGEGITYWPIGEIVRGAAGITEADDAPAARARLREGAGSESDSARIADLVASAIGLAEQSAPREELFWGVRRWLEAQARGGGLVCVIEDIHWAEPTLLDLLEHIADWTREASILLLCTARPELLEARPTWGGGKVNATTLLLEPLTSAVTQELVETLVDRESISPDVLRRILETAEGNPLFAEEIVRMLVDDGVIAGLGQHVQGMSVMAAGAVRIPTSVQSVIAARLDRLPAAERGVAERASVAGRVFERGAVVAMMPEADRQNVPQHLLALVRKELVHPDRPELTGDDAFRFRHLLIRDTVYEALPKERRADLHERFADWVEQVTGERASEYGEIVGYHYEQAQRYRHELGLDDARTAELADRAGVRLAAAGRRAYLRGDADGALNLVQRAATLLRDQGDRIRALTLLAFAARGAGQFTQARRYAADLLIAAEAAGNVGAARKGRLLDQLARGWSDPNYSVELAVTEAEADVAMFEASADEEGLALAHQVFGEAHLAKAKWGRARDAFQLAMTHSDRAGDWPHKEHMRVNVVAAALWGPTTVDEVIDLMKRELAEIQSQDSAARVKQLGALAYAMAGSATEARELMAESRRVMADFAGEDRVAVFTEGFVEYVLGDLDAAAAAYQQTATAFARQDETGARSTILALHALAEYDAGLDPLAVTARAEQGRSLGSPDDAVTQTLWRVAQALAHAKIGNVDEARRLIREAAAVSDETDFLYLRGVVARDAGRIAELAGDGRTARGHYKDALQYFEQKGDAIDAARMRERLGPVQGS